MVECAGGAVRQVRLPLLLVVVLEVLVRLLGIFVCIVVELASLVSHVTITLDFPLCIRKILVIFMSSCNHVPFFYFVAF